MEEQIFNILKDLGFFTIAAFFIKKIIENSANKRLEEFKSTLSIIQSKQTLLHNKRLEIIEEMYSKLVDLNSKMFTLTNPIKQTEKDFKEYEKQLIENASLSYNLFNEFYQKNKIYFNENTCLIIDEILSGFHQAFWDYNEHKLYEENGEIEKEAIINARRKMIDSYKSVKEEIPKVRKKLEKDFRNLLNVE